MTSPQIWLVEDEASIADTLIYSLETDGFAVRWFERGLPLLCRTGPSGAPPGGAGFAQTTSVHRGRHHRPWRVASLAVEAVGEDRRLRWTPRSRRFGDSWEGETAASDPERYRIDIVRDGAIVRSWETAEASAVFAAADRVADFSSGGEGRIRVSQWGEAFGWGAEAEIALA